jgi:hypothetical protein
MDKVKSRNLVVSYNKIRRGKGVVNKIKGGGRGLRPTPPRSIAGGAGSPPLLEKSLV